MTGTDRAVATFTSVGHGTMHGYELAIPIFVPLWIAEFDTTAAVLGVVAAVGFAALGAFAPVAGALSDRVGSRRIVLTSIGGMGLAFALLSVVETILGLAAVLVMWGLAASLYHPAGLSLISRSATRRGRVLALHGVGGNVGTVLVPLAAIVLLAGFGWRPTALVLATLAVPSLLAGLVLRIDEGDLAAEAAGPAGALERVGAYLTGVRALLVGGFLFVLGVQLLYGAYYRGIITFLPDVLGSVPGFAPVAVGGRSVGSGQLAYMLLLLVGAVGQYGGGIASDRVAPERALAVTLGILAVLTLSFPAAMAVGPPAVLALCAVTGLFLYAFAPIAQHLVAKYVAEGRHGTSYGLVYLAAFGMGAVGAAIAGLTLDVGGTGALFAVLAAVAGAAALVATALYLRSRLPGRPATAG